MVSKILNKLILLWFALLWLSYMYTVCVAWYWNLSKQGSLYICLLCPSTIVFYTYSEYINPLNNFQQIICRTQGFLDLSGWTTKPEYNRAWAIQILKEYWETGWLLPALTLEIWEKVAIPPLHVIVKARDEASPRLDLLKSVLLISINII